MSVALAVSTCAAGTRQMSEGGERQMSSGPTCSSSLLVGTCDWFLKPEAMQAPQCVPPMPRIQRQGKKTRNRAATPCVLVFLCHADKLETVQDTKMCCPSLSPGQSCLSLLKLEAARDNPACAFLALKPKNNWWAVPPTPCVPVTTAVPPTPCVPVTTAVLPTPWIRLCFTTCRCRPVAMLICLCRQDATIFWRNAQLFMSREMKRKEHLLGRAQL